jgi:hypothetical protein
VVRRGTPDEVTLEAGENVSMMVADRGYLRSQRRWTASWKAGPRGRSAARATLVRVPGSGLPGQVRHNPFVSAQL